MAANSMAKKLACQRFGRAFVGIIQTSLLLIDEFVSRSFVLQSIDFPTPVDPRSAKPHMGPTQQAYDRKPMSSHARHSPAPIPTTNWRCARVSATPAARLLAGHPCDLVRSCHLVAVLGPSLAPSTHRRPPPSPSPCCKLPDPSPRRSSSSSLPT